MRAPVVAVAFGVLGLVFSFGWLRKLFAASAGGASDTATPIELPPIAFTPAPFFRPTPAGVKRKIRWIVIHDAECKEGPAAAEGLAAYGKVATNGSWHYAVDENSITQSVRDNDVAHAAPPLNDEGLHIEIAGFANQTPEQWDDASSRATLDLAARLVAAKAREHGIPLVGFLTSEDLNPGGRGTGPTADTPNGITAHMAVSRAWKKSTHMDPGVSFPFDAFMAKVRSYAA